MTDERARRNRGVLATLERLISAELTALLAYAGLLTTFNLSFVQYTLATIVFVNLTTEPAAWLKAERDARARDRRANADRREAAGPEGREPDPKGSAQ